MFLHLGQGAVVQTDSIIGIFDMDTATVARRTRDFLARAESSGRCVTVSAELPASFTVTDSGVYISQLSPSALKGRAEAVHLYRKQ